VRPAGASAQLAGAPANSPANTADLPPAGDLTPPPGGLRVDEENGVYVVIGRNPWSLSIVAPDTHGAPRIVYQNFARDNPRLVLYWAVSWCDAKLVRALIEHYPEMLAPEKAAAGRSESLFVRACHIDPRVYILSPYLPFDRAGTLAALLDAGVVDAQERDNALAYLVENGTPADIEALLTHGANPNLIGKDGKTPPFYVELANGASPLYIALACGHEESAAVLRKYGAKPLVEGAPIHLAASAGDSAEVTRQLQANPQNRDMMNMQRRTPLMIAAACGELEAARVLLERGADPNGGNIRRYEAPIYAAARRGDTAMAELLLTCHADVDNRSVSPLCAAAPPDNDEALNVRRLAVAEMLLEHGADVNGVDRGEHITPLHASVRNVAMTKLLLEHGAKLEAKDDQGQTALFRAADVVNLPVAKLLIEHGADVNAREKDGHPVLYCAVKANNIPLAELLIEHGADVNALDNAGHSLLYGTLRPEIRDYLIAHGAK